MPANLLDHFPLRQGRAHEVSGPSAAYFAVISAATRGDNVLWVTEYWNNDMLNPSGLAQFFPPENLILTRTKNQIDSLASAEEALRSGAFNTVVVTLSQPLTLFTGRRLQLAAKEKDKTGIFIIPEGMGSNAAETRWRCSPRFDAKDSTLHRWQLIKNKSGTLGDWAVRWDEQARRVIVVSKVIE